MNRLYVPLAVLCCFLSTNVALAGGAYMKAPSSTSLEADCDDDSPIKLTIVVSGHPRRDIVVIDAEIHNMSNKSIRLDNLNAVFLRWRVVCDDENELLRPVTIEKTVKKTKESLAKTAIRSRSYSPDRV
jgi:hypothetical protein